MSPSVAPVRTFRVSIEVEREQHYRRAASLRKRSIALPPLYLDEASKTPHPDRLVTVDEVDLPSALEEMCRRAFTRYRSFRPHVVVCTNFGTVTRSRIDEIREELALEEAEATR